MKTFILASAPLLAFAAPAHAESWRVATYKEDSPAVVVFIDEDTVHRSGNITTFSAETISEEYSSEGVADRAIYSIKANCQTYKFTIPSLKFYKANDYVSTEDNSAEQSAETGTLYRSLLKVACGVSGYETTVIGDPVEYADDFFAELAGY